VPVFNRVLIIVVAIVLLVSAVAVLLTSTGVTQPAEAAPAGSWFVDRLTPFAQLDQVGWVWAIGVSVGLVVLAVLLLFVELRPGPQPPRRLILNDDESGRVTVALAGIRDLVDREASQVAGVKRARSQIDEAPGGLEVSCRISVDPTSSVPALTGELRERLKAAVEHHVGLAVTRVSVDADVAPLPSDRQHGRRLE
jgi:hypothetical protein